MINGSSGFLKDSASNVDFRFNGFTRAICLRVHAKTLNAVFVRDSAYVTELTYRC